mmetsp:Transcript_29526/g.41166  ORF Transcript_29526/g.41166 Transcript_29526/m.41166 type:complete len:219 (+) Transcript_29526:109-765(+)|eukprot:CAMPEP_0185259140 /NCGR_PEP_ID=MMETSP1359-20130426/7967_1 /TAXON_ID=552665 /ORGANISM="Bigelowiella longifila, Strain CCMP242" /LENGTH=218 /DNA_ID=CAMNT_0027844937 /DNA_START=82 /DNA_END=741 /DNA_ORIENTATION=-
MFKKFDAETDIRSHTQMKASVARKIIKEAKTRYPQLGEIMDMIFPKKQPVYLVKCAQHVTCVESRGFWWFWRIRDGPLIPTLRCLHKFPELIPSVTVDKGAIRHVLKGSKIMSPGLTSAGGCIEGDMKKGDAVVVMAEGMKYALAVGLLEMDASEIRETKKGVAIDNILYLNDGLWQATAPKVEVADERKSTGKNKKKQNDAKPEQDEEEVNFDDEDL